MSWPTIFGLPAHPLLVHATVIMVPLAAFAVLLHTFWARARTRLGLVTLLAAALAVVLVPLSTSTGEQLEHEVGRSALVERHAELADGLLPWVISLLVVAALLWVRDRRDADKATPVVSAGPGRTITDALLKPVVIGVLAVMAVLGTTQQVVRIGHSGAKAAWNRVDTSQSPPTGSSDGDGN
ncbi:MAG: DUF2231 domain-containing protein [Sporichthyaceae bacterium]